MVQVNSFNNNIKVTATAKKTLNNAVEASNSMAKHWADVAKEYAESAEKSEQNADNASNQVEQATTSALNQITECKNTAIEEINKLYPEIGEQVTKVSQLENDAGYLTENDTIKVKHISKDEYNQLPTKDQNTLYIITTHLLYWGTGMWNSEIWGLNDE